MFQFIRDIAAVYDVQRDNVKRFIAFVRAKSRLDLVIGTKFREVFII